jgi:Domain of unknown function (DUF3536)/Glycosyl hydrolase family 57
VSRARLVVHAHFYQPSRIDPFSGTVPADPSAAPGHDWTARVSADCYRPNAEAGNLAHISWDIGPTLAGWMYDGDQIAYRGFVAGDLGVNGMAQPFHHTILPLSSTADRETEIIWGLRDFEHRFGRAAVGMWLPETAVDLATLRLLDRHRVRHTILAPWQVVGHHAETRRPYRVELGNGRSIVVAVYDAGLSSAISFEPGATGDADQFMRDRVTPRAADSLPDGEPPVLLIATDGELYGHHQVFRELFLQRLVQPREDRSGVAVPVVPLVQALQATPSRPFRTVRLVERTSWSCHHGVLRWSGECPCTDGSTWKAPLRSAFDRLAAGIDALTDRVAADLPGAPDPWAARNDYVAVVIEAESGPSFADRWLGATSSPAEGITFLTLMEIQRWRLAMFASDAWFWEEPVRTETMSALRAAAWAARRMDRLAGSILEPRLLADLATFTSPTHGIDGAEIYRRALAEVGQV